MCVLPAHGDGGRLVVQIGLRERRPRHAKLVGVPREVFERERAGDAQDDDVVGPLEPCAVDVGMFCDEGAERVACLRALEARGEVTVDDDVELAVNGTRRSSFLWSAGQGSNLRLPGALLLVLCRLRYPRMAGEAGADPAASRVITPSALPLSYSPKWSRRPRAARARIASAVGPAGLEPATSEVITLGALPTLSYGPEMQKPRQHECWQGPFPSDRSALSGLAVNARTACRTP